MNEPSPGSFNCLVEIQQYTLGKDASGGKTKVWDIEVAKPFAGINNLSGKEQSATRAGGDVVVSRTIFSMHYIPGITDVMRVVYAGKYFDIQHVNNFMERNQYLILTCDSGVNLG